MFLSGFQENNQNSIHIRNITNIILENLIKFFYTGTLVKVNINNVEVIFFLQ